MTDSDKWKVRIYYRGEVTYRADCWTEDRYSNVELFCNDAPQMSILDSESGIQIEGSDLSLSLDYGTAGDLLQGLLALQDYYHKIGNPMLIDNCDAEYVTVVRPRRTAKPKFRKRSTVKSSTTQPSKKKRKK